MILRNPFPEQSIAARLWTLCRMPLCPDDITIQWEASLCKRCHGEGWLYPIDPARFDGSYITARPCPSCNHGGFQP